MSTYADLLTYLALQIVQTILIDVSLQFEIGFLGSFQSLYPLFLVQSEFNLGIYFLKFGVLELMVFVVRMKLLSGFLSNDEGGNHEYTTLKMALTPILSAPHFPGTTIGLIDFRTTPSICRISYISNKQTKNEEENEERTKG